MPAPMKVRSTDAAQFLRGFFKEIVQKPRAACYRFRQAFHLVGIGSSFDGQPKLGWIFPAAAVHIAVRRALGDLPLFTSDFASLKATHNTRDPAWHSPCFRMWRRTSPIGAA